MAKIGERKRKAPGGRRRKRRAGMPDEASVVSEQTFTSPKGTVYRILTTTEKDPYDRDGRKRKRRG